MSNDSNRFHQGTDYTVEICAVDFKRLFDRERRPAEFVIIHERNHPCDTFQAEEKHHG